MSDERGRFDRAADAVARAVAHPAFFGGCLLLVLVWLPLGLVLPPGTTWQLAINTPTTILTFLLLALLYNDQARFQRATNRRLQDLAERQGDDPVDDEGQRA